MISELREIHRFAVHHELHKDGLTLLALALFVAGLTAFAVPLASTLGAW